ncbi:hypothetical protein BGX38DRAFT_1147036 [Terfezia claveryi]|nr:hypothetical protein BGX38DRAFT_1147036 [Terfezia claveryi]
MVILVHIPEVIPTKYMLLQDYGGVEISAGKARKEMFKWQKAWFGGRNFEEEVIRRCIGEEEGKEQEVVSELKTDVMNKLLEESERGSLVPPLLHPLDGKIYVFKRKEEGQDVELISSQEASAKEGQNEETQGKRKREEEGDLSSNGSSEDHEVGLYNLAKESNKRVSKEGITTDRSDIPSPIANFNPPSMSSSTQEEDEEPDRSSQLMCIYDTSFLHNNLYTPGTPPMSATPHALTISITDLYGPYPTPYTLSLIPLALRPHADQKITLDLEELAERIIAEEVLCEMKVRRAGERAAKIIDGEWVVWVKKKEEERNRARMEEERNERNERRVRRVREVEDNMEGPNERGSGGGRKRGRGTSRV